MITIHNAIIAADLKEASYVKYGVEELRQFLAIDKPIEGHWNESAFKLADCIILIGREVVDSSPFSLNITDSSPGQEGFGISIFGWREKPVIAIAGSDSQGTKFGVIELLKNLRTTGGVYRIHEQFQKFEKPHFSIRAMYGHLHWQYNHPYACRSWKLEDWQSYVDLLTYFGANVLQIWPMLCLLPDPLSPEDKRYLQMFNELAEYARTCRGLEIWVGECCNNVALSDGGAEIAKREYFGNEKLLNPGDPAELKSLLSSRDNLYKTVDQASGYWMIDSDPGAWKGSPSADFVNVFKENQKLMKRSNKSDHARMLYWMQWSWGTGTRGENWTDTLKGLLQDVEEPWNILMGTYPEHLQIVEAMGLQDKVIFFPYGTIEPEPSVPMTQNYFAAIKNSVDFALAQGFTKGMGQSQTAVVQLPNIYFFLRCLWNPAIRHEDPLIVLEQLGQLLYPQYAEIAAAGWLAMVDSTAAQMFACLDRLDFAINECAHALPSSTGRFLFGSPAIVLEDLRMQLAIRANGQAFLEGVQKSLDLERIKHYFQQFIESILCWRDRHNYLAMGGWKYAYGPSIESAVAGIRDYEKQYGDLGFLFDVEWPVKSSLFQKSRFHPGFIDGVLTEIRSQVNVK